MGVRELNRDQLIELKVQYLMDIHNGNVSYGEIAEADDIVSDATVYEYYSGYTFSPDDFASSAEQPEDEYNLELGDCIGDRTSIAADLRQIADLIENGYYSGMADYGTSWSIM